MKTIEPIDHIARGWSVPLRVFVKDLRDRASDAAWNGDLETAARLDRRADAAIQAGHDPVPRF